MSAAEINTNGTNAQLSVTFYVILHVVLRMCRGEVDCTEKDMTLLTCFKTLTTFQKIMGTFMLQINADILII